MAVSGSGALLEHIESGSGDAAASSLDEYPLTCTLPRSSANFGPVAMRSDVLVMLAGLLAVGLGARSSAGLESSEGLAAGEASSLALLQASSSLRSSSPLTSPVMSLARLAGMLPLASVRRTLGESLIALAALALLSDF